VLQGLQKGLHHHERHTVRQPQAALRGYLAAIAVFCNEVKGKSVNFTGYWQRHIQPCPLAVRCGTD